MKLLLIKLALFSVLLKTGFSSSQPCYSRSYGKDSFVCVCDSHRCDTFDQTPNIKKGKAIMFVSDREKYRFKQFDLEFKLKPHNLLNRTLFSISRSSKKDTNSKIIGFGGSFTDAAGLNVYKLDSSLAKNIVNNYYGKDGLRYSMGRVPIGGSDFSTRPYTYDDIDENGEDFDLKHFKLAEEDFKYKIPFIQEALKLAPSLKLFASPWSAPKWMKTNHNLNGKGELRGDVHGKYYQTWAKYFVKFLQEYSSHKIHFWGLTIQNEPYDGTLDNFVFNCMAMSPEKQRDFIKFDLWPSLNNSGFKDIKLLIGDDQLPFIKKYADVILQDKEAAKLVAGIGFHWYMNAFGPEVLKNLTEKYENHFFISTEACEGSNPFDAEKVILGSWQRAENYAFDIIQDLSHNAAGWIDWNMALDLEGGPNWVSNFVDSPIIVNATAGEYYKQPMYYILGHFSRYLPPGSLKLDAEVRKVGDNDAIDGVFYSVDNGKQTVAILLNRYNSHVPVQLEDASKPGQTLNFEMLPKSIATILW